MKRMLISGLVLVTMTAASAVAEPIDGKGNDVLTGFGGFYQPSTTITGELLSSMKRGMMICYPLPPEDCQ